jgi:cytochrome c554/c'-like protein
MIRRLRQGFVASLLGLGLSGVSGCGDTLPPAPSAGVATPSPGKLSVENNTPPVIDELPLARDDSRTPNPAEDGSAIKTDDRTTETPSGIQKTSNESPAATAKAATPAKPLFDGWDKPAVVLVLSGEQHGYLEPCGCSEHQSGGVSRRHDLIKQLDSKKWPLTSLDLGGTVNRTRAQTKLKFQTFLAAMKDMRYSVLNLGPEELKLGAADLLAFHTPDAKDPLGSLGFLSANVTLFSSPELGTPIRSKLLTIGKLKVGVTSILGATFRKEIAPPGANVDITIDDPEAALPAVLMDLQARKPDLLVLLAHVELLAESKKLAQIFPQFNLIVSSGGAEDPEFANPQKIGNTLLVQVGHKGKYTGVVGFFPNDPKERLRFELVKLTEDRFQDSEKMTGHMRFYQQVLEKARLAENEPPIKHASGAKFVGSKVCGECHSKAFDVWKDSGHAHAYDSLIKGRPELKDRWVSRIHDPECLSCHVTGWHAQDVLRYESGFLNADKTAHLLHNGCENCHGPGSNHIELIDKGDKEAARKEVRITLEAAKKTQCVTCHDLDNSPKFTFETYWEKIKHKGLD